MEAYKHRMIDEYTELSGRLDRLQAVLNRWADGALDFEPTCPRELLENQRDVMVAYRDILEKRAVIEGTALTAARKEAA